MATDGQSNDQTAGEGERIAMTLEMKWSIEAGYRGNLDADDLIKAAYDDGDAAADPTSGAIGMPLAMPADHAIGDVDAFERALRGLSVGAGRGARAHSC
jgi:hypothetical protein